MAQNPEKQTGTTITRSLRTLRSWLRTRFQTFDLLPEYLGAIIEEWMNILFGETIVGAGFLIWWALTNPKNPPLIAVFVVAMFVAGYYVWRADLTCPPSLVQG